MNTEIKFVLPITLDRAKMEIAYASLGMCGWDTKKTAKALGISRNGLTILKARMRDFGYYIPRNSRKRNISDILAGLDAVSKRTSGSVGIP